MTKEQEEHLIYIKHKFHSLVDPKYRKGAEEHGGNIWDLTPTQLIDNSIEEAIDQVVYLLTLKAKL